MKTLGILVGGGPAPGINGVIAAATIEARNHGLRVLGLYDGYKWLVRGDTTHVRELEIAEVSRIHFEGGSILRTSRENPAKSPEALASVVGALRQLGVSYLVTIGGDDTAYAASRISAAVGPDIGVAHVPKTIDNDLPLPRGGRHVRVHHRLQPGQGHRPQPDARRGDDRAVVLRHGDGPAGGPPRPRHRRLGRGHADRDPRGVRRRADLAGTRGRRPGGRHREAPGPGSRPRRRAHRRGVGRRARPGHAGPGGARQLRQRPALRAGPRPSPQGARRRLAGRPGAPDHHRRQGPRLRAALRSARRLRHPVLPEPRLLGNPAAAGRAAPARW